MKIKLNCLITAMALLALATINFQLSTAIAQGVTFTNKTFNVGSGSAFAAVADIFGNGKLALITANSGGGSGNTVTVLTNNGSGGFGFNATLTVGGNPQSVVAADVNGDGKFDLISANSVALICHSYLAKMQQL